MHRLGKAIMIFTVAACCSLLSGCSATGANTQEQAARPQTFISGGQRVTVALAPGAPISLRPIQISVSVRPLGHGAERIHGVWVSEHMDVMTMPIPPVTLRRTATRSFRGALVFVMAGTWRIHVHLNTSAGRELEHALTVQVQ
ncbi:MAG: hypothetical protein ACYCVB_02210 [Bacilli bacterium]